MDYQKLVKILFLVFLFFLACFPFASVRAELQLRYPELNLPGFRIPLRITHDMGLGGLALYIYYFIVIIGGIIAFCALIYGGIRFLISLGSPTAKSEAKKQIIAAFLGLALLLGSWVILHTIDPGLVVIHMPKPIEPVLPGGEPASFRDGIALIPVHLHYKFLIEERKSGEGISRVPGIIRIPSGNIPQVGRVEEFPLAGGGSIDLTGEMHSFVFVSPKKKKIDPETREYIRDPVTLEHKYEDEALHYYGLACFEYPELRGRVRILDSRFTGPSVLIERDKKDRIEYFVLNPEIPDPGLNVPCLSMLFFKRPAESIYTAGMDGITFFEHHYPDREYPGKGACLEISGDNISRYGCQRVMAELKGEEPGLYHGIVPGEPPGERIRNVASTKGNGWYPLSMEIDADKSVKYLVFLWPTEPGNKKHWDRGDTYWFHTDVPNFGDTADGRLYWPLEPEPTRPKSFLILQVLEVF